jgi:hypothetical protein
MLRKQVKTKNKEKNLQLRKQINLKLLKKYKYYIRI